MKKKILIIGANEFQNKLVQTAKKKNIETHVFAWEQGAIAKDNSDYFYPISIVEKEEILKKALEIKPDGVCTIATDLAMPTVAYLTEKLNLIGNSVRTTRLTTNKYEMREEFLKNNLPSPKFQLIGNIRELDSSFDYPLIVKPIDRSGSRGITKVESIEELEEAFQSALDESFIDKVLIEEFIDGKEYSIEMITQNGNHQFLQITEKFTTGAPNFIEVGHLAPARINDKELEKEVIKIIKKALDALGVTNGASHSEIKITENKEIKIIEIGARMGGDFIGSDLVKISKGIDYNELVLKVSLGEEIQNFENTSYISNSLVRFILTEEDVIKYKTIIRNNSHLIKESNINSVLNTEIKDSSTRNGYYIMEIKEKETLTKILDFLGREVNDKF